MYYNSFNSFQAYYPNHKYAKAKHIYVDPFPDHALDTIENFLIEDNDISNYVDDVESNFNNGLDPKLTGRNHVEEIEIPRSIVIAALTYIEAKDYPNDVCKDMVTTFMNTILDGGSVSEATAALENVYVDKINRFGSSQATGACKAAENAYLTALALKQNPLKAAITDFIYNSPTPRNNDPCGLAAKAFFDVSSQGVSYEKVLKESTRVFVKAFNLFDKTDDACIDAALAYLKATGNEGLGPLVAGIGF